jgi:hypothetical protein
MSGEDFLSPNEFNKESRNAGTEIVDGREFKVERLTAEQQRF